MPKKRDRAGEWGEPSMTLPVSDIVASILPLFKERPGIVAGYLFGSVAEGTEGKNSDVDIAALGRLELDEVIRFENVLENALGRKVDLVDLRRANPFLALDVIKGIRFYATDEIYCDEYELYILRRAGDLEPFERARRAQLLGRSRL